MGPDSTTPTPSRSEEDETLKTLNYADAGDCMVDFWGEPGAERLEHAAIDELVEAILDGSLETAGTLVVHGWRRRDVPDTMRACLAARTLEGLLERLDICEGLGDPEDATKPTAGMKAAARAFVDAVAAEYDVWACVPVVVVEVDVAEWIAANAPHWLDEGR